MGLIDQNMKPPAAPAPQAGAPAEPQPPAEGEEGGAAATPQEQDAYERVVLAGLQVLYAEQTHAQIMNMLKGGEAPEKDISDTVALIMSQLDKQSGGKIPQVVIIPAAVELVSATAELGEQAGIFQADQRVLARAVQMVIINLCNEYGVDPAEIQEIMKSLDPQKMQQMVEEQRQMTADGPAAQAPAQPGAAPAAQPAEEEI